MADKINKIKVGKVVSPVAKPARNVLRVSDPNDKRLKMYEDSLLATGRAVASREQVERLGKMPMEKRRTEVLKGFTSPSESKEAIARLEKANKKPYKDTTDESRKVTIETPEGLGFTKGQKGFKPVVNPKGDLPRTKDIAPLNVITPKREVIYEKPPEKPKPKPKPTPKPEPKAEEPAPRPKQEPIERLEPRTVSTKISTPEREMVAPVLRPVKIEKPQEVTPRKRAKFIMPTRQGGWSKQPLLMKLFPKLYMK